MPLPVAAVMPSQAALLVAVHAHPVAEVTVTVAPVMPAAGALTDGAEIVGVHGAPAWVKVKALPPIVSVAVRAVVVGLAVTL